MKATISYKSFTKQQESLYNIILNLTLNDGNNDVFTKDYIIDYQPDNWSISNKYNVILLQMQTDINNYIYDTTLLTNSLNDINILISSLKENLKV